MYGSHCTCTKSVKPCELERHDKRSKAKRKKKMERYDKSSRKMRF